MRNGIFVFGDLHLGKSSAPGAQWAKDAMDRARAAGAVACVCAGDIIHRTVEAGDPAFGDVMDVMGHALENFDEVHFIAGNHDVNVDFQLPEGVVVHSTEPHAFECAGTIVHTASVKTDPDPRQMSFPVRGSALAGATNASDASTVGKPHLGILHSSVTGEFSKNPCLPITLEELLACNYDAWVLAHVHVPRVLNEDPFIGWVGMGEGLIYWPEKANSVHVERMAQ